MGFHGKKKEDVILSFGFVQFFRLALPFPALWQGQNDICQNDWWSWVNLKIFKLVFKFSESFENSEYNRVGEISSGPSLKLAKSIHPPTILEALFQVFRDPSCGAWFGIAWIFTCISLTLFVLISRNEAPTWNSCLSLLLPMSISLGRWRRKIRRKKWNSPFNCFVAMHPY